MNLPFKLTICALWERDQYRSQGVTHMLSILDLRDDPKPPAWFDGPHKLVQITDLESKELGLAGSARIAQESDVIEIVAFGRQCCEDARSKGVHLLVHCFAGISRSTAAAFLIAADALGERHEANALEHVISVRPRADPNHHIVALGDRLLGREGRLLEFVVAHRLGTAGDTPNYIDL